MEWSKEERYRRLEDASAEEISDLKARVDSCPWRQSYHIQPVTGLLNDPNGFSYYNGEYHLFYQWFPLGPVHGLKYWYHVRSKDLVHWENVGLGIKPDSQFDSYGAYSGSAIEHEGKLYLMYTGNTRDEEWRRYPKQCLAVMDPEGNITKLDKPVIPEVPEGYTEHFRDPKVWEEKDRFYTVIGAQRKDETGTAVLYSSQDLIQWTFEGELETKLQDFGFMWECPDYFSLQDKGVFIFSPQGLEPQGDKYRNIYQSGYIIGDKLNLNNRRLNHGDFHELDRGFDFYAPQTMEGPKGRRILVGWMGMGEVEYPTDKNGWAHCLTLPRELSIENGRIIQKPLKELESLRRKEYRVKDEACDEIKAYDELKGITYELIGEFKNHDAEEFGIEFRASEEEKTVIKYDSLQKKLILDRSVSGEEFGLEYGNVRACDFQGDSIRFHLFVDVSSVEIFINDGAEVFTSRIFPKKDSRDIRIFATKGRASFDMVKWDY
ncbi:MAG: glycoside hydrolase family 32 protein [Clostridiaceae bacterium]